MNWDLAIEINRRALLRLLRGLLEMVGAGETVTRSVRSAALAILLPAESATRRLIAIVARGVVVEPRGTRRSGRRAGSGESGSRKSGGRGRWFLLIDPRRYAGPPLPKRLPGNGPGVRGFEGGETGFYVPKSPSPDDPVSAAGLSRRLAALGDALADIPLQARRLARFATTRSRPLRPMRPGRPPGHRAKGRRPVDELLADCHALALMALAEPEPPDKT